MPQEPAQRASVGALWAAFVYLLHSGPKHVTVGPDTRFAPAGDNAAARPERARPVSPSPGTHATTGRDWTRRPANRSATDATLS